MSIVLPIGALLLAVAVSGGCALHRPHSLAPDGARVSRAARAPDAASPLPAIGAAATLEASDPILTEALLAVKMAPGSVQHRRVAERYVQLHILDAAYDHFARARDLDATDGAAYEGLARIWREWGFADRGLGDAFRGVHHASSSPAAHNTLGTLLLALGRATEARRAFERALALDDSPAYVLNNLCYLSFLTGELAQAMNECDAALAADPEFAPARNNLGLVYAASQREDLALREFHRAGDPAAASYNIGLVLLADRQYRKASQAFDEASRQRPAWSAPRARARKTRALAVLEEHGRLQ